MIQRLQPPPCDVLRTPSSHATRSQRTYHPSVIPSVTPVRNRTRWTENTHETPYSNASTPSSNSSVRDTIIPNTERRQVLLRKVKSILDDLEHFEKSSYEMRTPKRHERSSSITSISSSSSSFSYLPNHLQQQECHPAPPPSRNLSHPTIMTTQDDWNTQYGSATNTFHRETNHGIPSTSISWEGVQKPKKSCKSAPTTPVRQRSIESRTMTMSNTSVNGTTTDRMHHRKEGNFWKSKVPTEIDSKSNASTTTVNRTSTHSTMNHVTHNNNVFKEFHRDITAQDFNHSKPSVTSKNYQHDTIDLFSFPNPPPPPPPPQPKQQLQQQLHKEPFQTMRNEDTHWMLPTPYHTNMQETNVHPQDHMITPSTPISLGRPRILALPSWDDLTRSVKMESDDSCHGRTTEEKKNSTVTTDSTSSSTSSTSTSITPPQPMETTTPPDEVLPQFNKSYESDCWDMSSEFILDTSYESMSSKENENRLGRFLVEEEEEENASWTQDWSQRSANPNNSANKNLVLFECSTTKNRNIHAHDPSVSSSITSDHGKTPLPDHVGMTDAWKEIQSLRQALKVSEIRREAAEKLFLYQERTFREPKTKWSCVSTSATKHQSNNTSRTNLFIASHPVSPDESSKDSMTTTLTKEEAKSIVELKDCNDITQPSLGLHTSTVCMKTESSYSTVATTNTSNDHQVGSIKSKKKEKRRNFNSCFSSLFSSRNRCREYD